MKINSLLHQLEVLASGWEKYAINETFSGYTLEQLEALIQSLRELLAVMDALKLDYRGKIAARQTMGTELGDILLRTVNCIRGHESLQAVSSHQSYTYPLTSVDRKKTNQVPVLRLSSQYGE